MSWSLQGSYVETCSCDLMCPCNFSFDTARRMTPARLGMFMDGRASDEQVAKLTAVFGGQKGGPMAGLVPLVSDMLGVLRVPIEVVDDGLRHSVRIGDAIDFEIEDIVPFGVDTGEPVRLTGMFHPVGSTLTAAEAKRSRINAFGIQFEGRTGLSSAEFNWAA